MIDSAQQYAAPADKSGNPFVNAIYDVLVNQEPIGRESLLAIQRQHQVENLADYNEDLLDVILDYIGQTLNDHHLTPHELSHILRLKRLFGIKEGDFHRLRYAQVQDLLHHQCDRIYRDGNRISLEEALNKVNLQDAFDLSYDQFLAFKENEIRLALGRGVAVFT